MTREWKPLGYNSVSPYLITKNAEAVIDYLGEVLSGRLLRRYDMPDGSLMHAEVRIDDTVVMIGQAGGDWRPVPCHLHVYVPDVDATYARALEHGCVSVQAPERKRDDPDRRGGVLGPGGNTWWFGTQLAG